MYKIPVMFRKESGKPDVVGCVLLYYLLRHKSMLSKENVETSCDALMVDVKCGWRQADSVSRCEPRIRLQKWPSIHKRQFSPKYNDEQTKIIEEKYNDVCKSLLKRVEDIRIRKGDILKGKN